jgi:hypothetical protein
MGHFSDSFELLPDQRLHDGIPFAEDRMKMKAVVAHHEKEVEAVAREIVEYLSLNPDAADTVEGIVTWWVERQRHFEARSLVESALQYLVERGIVEMQRTTTGAVVYRKKSDSEKM